MRGSMVIVGRSRTYAKSTVAHAKPQFMTAHRRQADSMFVTLILESFVQFTNHLGPKALSIKSKHRTFMTLLPDSSLWKLVSYQVSGRDFSPT